MRWICLVGVVVLAACGNGTEGANDSATASTSSPALDLDALTSDDRPSKRSEMIHAAHPATNSILLFGGNDGPIVQQWPQAAFLQDTWVFEPGIGWTEVVGDDQPRKRARSAVAVDPDGNRALVFGGRFRPEDQDGDYTVFNDLWSFDFVSRTWTQLDDGSGAGPAPRYYGRGAWDASTETFYVWGGNLNTSAFIYEVTMELWAWDGSGWTELETSGEMPSDRSFLGSVHDAARNELIVFGGQLGDLTSGSYNDTYGLNLDSGVWRKLHDGSGKAPSTRMHGQLLHDETQDRYLLFGGHTDTGDMNDLWAFDPEAQTWSKTYIADTFNDVEFGCLGNSSEVPADYVDMDLSAPERRHNALVTWMHDSVWIFGGMHAECSDYLNDTWRYDLASDTWIEIMEASSGEACLRSDDDCECLCI
jgi:N-acetylneuraminic acid mutarotase